MPTKPNIKISLGARGSIFAPKGRCIIGLDFSSQELMIAAVLSGDPVMLQTFRAPKLIPDEHGVLVDNADADMHCLTAVQSFAKVFTDATGVLIPKTKWVKQSKDESLISLPGTPRDYGKLLAAV